MNSDQIEGKWKRFTGAIYECWADSPTEKDQLVGQIPERYRVAMAETVKRADRWSRALKESQR